jgi:hypothetical protein
MHDRQVRQMQRILKDHGTLGFLKICYEVIGHQEITNNSSRNDRLKSLYEDLLELYRRWYDIDIKSRWNSGQLP